MDRAKIERFSFSTNLIVESIFSKEQIRSDPSATAVSHRRQPPPLAVAAEYFCFSRKSAEKIWVSQKAATKMISASQPKFYRLISKTARFPHFRSTVRPVCRPAGRNAGTSTYRIVMSFIYLSAPRMTSLVGSRSCEFLAEFYAY